MTNLLEQTYYAHSEHCLQDNICLQDKEFRVWILLHYLRCSHFVVSEFPVDNLYSLDVFNHHIITHNAS